MENLLEDFSTNDFLLAVSGGADSMVLAHLFQASGLRYQVAHINYKLRAQESDNDAKLVEDFCREHQVKFHYREISEQDTKPKGSVQLWARNIRYGYFRKIQAEEKLQYLVTAHHLNDQLETFLINLSRGSGIKGLCGIPEKENNILRPLLTYTKEDIYHFAKEHLITFREDASNQKNDYLRNRIRNRIVPELLATNDQFLENFSKSLRILSQTQNFVETEISRKIRDNETILGGKKIINKNKIEKESPLLQYETFARMGFDEKQIEKILKAETGSIFHVPGSRLAVNRNELIVEPVSDPVPGAAEIIKLEINSENEVVVPENIKKEFYPNEVNWIYDFDRISFPLTLRHKKQGDVFFPIGMIGKKKLSKFFKDEKISILAKPNIWILCDGNDDVLGVLPWRQDRRFAADTDTKNFLKFKI